MRVAVLSVLGRVFAARPGDAALDERLGDAVIGALNSREDPVRETAMWALGMMRYQRAVEGLSSLLTFYRKGPLAERAFDAMGRIGHDANMPQFIERLNGKDLTMRMIAIEGIARSGDRERNAAVQAAIAREKHEAILLAAHFANVMLANGSITTIVEALDRERLREQALQYVYDLAPGRAAALGALIRPASGRVRLDVVDALGMSGDPAAVGVLEPLSADKDPEVALVAQRALARLR
jgi:HEAT repeat protein